MSTRNDSPLQTEDLKTQASEAARKVGEQIQEQANILRDATASVRYNTQEFIENNPWQSVAMAAAVGFLVGVIVTRR